MADFLDKLDQAEKRDDVRLSNQPSGSSSLGDAHVVMTHDGSAGKHGKGKGAKDKEKKAKTKKGHEAKVGEKKPKKTAEKKGKKVKKGAEDQASGDNPTTAAEASAAASVPPPQDSTAQLADGDGAEPATEAPAGAPAIDGESVGATLWKEKAGMDQLRSAGLVESKLLLRNLFRPMNWWRSDPEQANLARRPQVRVPVVQPTPSPLTHLRPYPQAHRSQHPSHYIRSIRSIRSHPIPSHPIPSH